MKIHYTYSVTDTIEEHLGGGGQNGIVDNRVQWLRTLGPRTAALLWGPAMF